MTVYLLHFDEPFGHATHYLGFAEPDRLADRLEHHRRGTGSNLCKHVARAGIGWQLSRLWEDGSRTEERRLKNRGGKARLCPLCDRKGLLVPAQRITAEGYVPVLSMAGSVVHAGNPDSTQLLCGRFLGDSWRTLPSDDAAAEVSALRRTGCGKCMRKVERVQVLKEKLIADMHQAIEESGVVFTGRTINELGSQAWTAGPTEGDR